MSRVQLALRVGDLEGSIAFYATLFGVEPAKRRPGYANVAVTEPPLKLVLLEGEPGQATMMDHLGGEVSSSDQVAQRLAALGLVTDVDNDTTCRYAVRDKVWVHGPGTEPWEIYVVKADSSTYATDQNATPGQCHTDTDQADAEATAKPIGCRARATPSLCGARVHEEPGGRGRVRSGRSR